MLPLCVFLIISRFYQNLTISIREQLFDEQLLNAFSKVDFDRLIVMKKFLNYVQSLLVSRRKEVDTGQKGFSIIQVVVATGLMSILGAAMAAMTMNLSSQLKFLEQKSEIIQLKSIIQLALLDPTTCKCNLDFASNPDLKFNSAIADGTQSMHAAKIKSGNCSALPASNILAEGQVLSSGIKVDKINFKNLLQPDPIGNPTRWKGQWEITIDPSSTKIPMKPILISEQVINVNADVPSTTKVVSCESSLLGSIGSCPGGTYLAGFFSNGDKTCLTLPTGGGAPPPPPPFPSVGCSWNSSGNVASCTVSNTSPNTNVCVDNGSGPVCAFMTDASGNATWSGVITCASSGKTPPCTFNYTISVGTWSSPASYTCTN